MTQRLLGCMIPPSLVPLPGGSNDERRDNQSDPCSPFASGSVTALVSSPNAGRPGKNKAKSPWRRDRRASGESRRRGRRSRSSRNGRPVHSRDSRRIRSDLGEVSAAGTRGEPQRPVLSQERVMPLVKVRFFGEALTPLLCFLRARICRQSQ